jgi:hypothetical protein
LTRNGNRAYNTSWDRTDLNQRLSSWSNQSSPIPGSLQLLRDMARAWIDGKTQRCLAGVKQVIYLRGYHVHD